MCSIMKIIMLIETFNYFLANQSCRNFCINPFINFVFLTFCLIFGNTLLLITIVELCYVVPRDLPMSSTGLCFFCTAVTDHYKRANPRLEFYEKQRKRGIISDWNYRRLLKFSVTAGNNCFSLQGAFPVAPIKLMTMQIGQLHPLEEKTCFKLKSIILYAFLI